MIGTKLAHYEITGHLGTGGMGEVYQATDSGLGRSVAIKLLPDAFTHDADRTERFQREARVLASLNHPNIAAIHGIEESGGRKFIVMELVPGETLAERIQRGPLRLDDAVSAGTQLLDGLEAAHEKGVIHRDLKPANIKLTEHGQLKVLDFGLAKANEQAPVNTSVSNSPTMLNGAATNAGMILGTAAYMSPEQARGRPVDGRTDIFAFGCVSDNGVLVINHGDASASVLTWYNRRGDTVRSLPPEPALNSIDPSPDGSRLAASLNSGIAKLYFDRNRCLVS